MSSLSLFCGLVSLSLGAILWPSELLFGSMRSMRLLLDLDSYGGVDPLGVSSISKEGCGYYCSKTKHNFSLAHPSGIVSGVLANVTAFPKGAPAPDRENYRLISITPILYKV